MLLPLCLLHITTPQSTYAFVSKRGKQPYMKSYKTNTSKSNTALLSWYYVLPVLIARCIICVPSVFINIGTSKNVLLVGKTANRNIKIKFRPKCNNNKYFNKIVTCNNQQKQQRSPLYDYEHQICLITNDQNNSNNIKKPCPMIFDSDSGPIRVDNCCSRTLSRTPHDFDKSTLANYWFRRD
jgi:hypothetical protein